MNIKNFLFGFISYLGAFLFITVGFLILFPKGLDDESLRVRFFWTHCLVFLIWFVNIGAALIGINDNRRLFGLGGLLPGAGIVTMLYAFFSFMLMVLASLIEPTGFINKYHLLIQLTTLFGYFLIMFVFCIAYEGARSGQDWDSNQGKVSIRNIENKLQLMEQLLEKTFISDDPKSSEIKRIFGLLKSKVNSSLPNSGRQLSNSEYIRFLNELDEVIVNKINNYKNLTLDESMIGEFFNQAKIFLDEINFKLDCAIKEFRS